MKQLDMFLENIKNKEEGFKLGEPWKYSKTSTGVIVPILRTGKLTREYVTLPEVKDKIDIKDTGDIDRIQIKGLDKNLFIRAGTVLEGIGTQPRTIEHSIIVESKVSIDLGVKCVQASHAIRGGSKFKYEGLVPRKVYDSLRTGDQARVWDSIRSHNAMFCMSARRLEGTDAAFIGAVESDNLIGTKEAARRIDKKFQDILKEVPVFENQIGAIIIGLRGIEGIESFDNPKSWKAQYKEVIESYSDTFQEDQNLFTINEENVHSYIKVFFDNLRNAEITKISNYTYTIQLKGYVGEAVVLDDSLVHVFVMQQDEEENKDLSYRNRRTRDRNDPFGVLGLPNQFRTIGRERPVRGLRFHERTKHALYKSKKGFGDVMYELEKGPKTWKELSSSTKVSSATLSNRIKDGKKFGLIREDIRQPGGKKVYCINKNENY